MSLGKKKFRNDQSNLASKILYFYREVESHIVLAVVPSFALDFFVWETHTPT